MHKKYHKMSYLKTKNDERRRIKKIFQVDSEYIFNQSVKDNIYPDDYIIPILKTNFIINPNHIVDDFNLLLPITKGKRFKKVLRYLKDKIGYLTLFRLSKQVANKYEIMVRVERFRVKINLLKKKNSLRKSIARLKFYKGKTLKEICILTGKNIRYIKAELKCLRYSSKSLFEILNPEIINHYDKLINSSEQLIKLYQRISFCSLSLKDQYRKFVKLKDENKSVPFKLFVKFLKNQFLLKRVKINRIGKSMDQERLRDSRKVICSALILSLIHI